MSQICQGLVISRFGSEADVELNPNEILRCHLRRKLQHLVCGDRVLCQVEENHKAVVTEILPRKNELLRPIRYQGLKAVAANIDQMIIMTAPEPEFSELILDKYLVVAENAGIDPIIVFNKSDRLIDYPDLKSFLEQYQQLDYEVIFISAKNNELGQFADIIKAKSNVLVGQSGVGKSSLVSVLLPETEIAVNEISENSGLGQHTTTASRLYHLENDASLIDSPGIREFSMEHFDAQDLIRGYREIHQFSADCKYRDCHHTHEPGCAVKSALDKHLISSNRYQRYLKLLHENK